MNYYDQRRAWIRERASEYQNQGLLVDATILRWFWRMLDNDTVRRHAVDAVTRALESEIPGHVSYSDGA